MNIKVRQFFWLRGIVSLTMCLLALWLSGQNLSNEYFLEFKDSYNNKQTITIVSGLTMCHVQTDDGALLAVKCDEGDFLFPIKDLVKISQHKTQITNVETLPANTLSVRFEGGEMSIENTDGVKVDIQIVDIKGDVVYSHSTANQKHTINVSDFHQGLYIIKVNNLTYKYIVK